MEFKYSKEELENAIKEVSKRAKCARELALEAALEEDRKLFEKQYEMLAKRVKELEAMLNELPNE
jgi:hypothetical protein